MIELPRLRAGDSDSPERLDLRDSHRRLGYRRHGQYAAAEPRFGTGIHVD